MFAQLGDIQFELITYFSGIKENSSYNYAQHERINKKPILQFLGENLKNIDLKLNFHSSFCTPSEELEKLKTVAELGTPLQFIKGNGEYLGVSVQIIFAKYSKELRLILLLFRLKAILVKYCDCI